MSRNPKLSDLQLILLSTAAQRADGSIFPVADSICGQGERIGKVIPPLLRRELVEERPVTDRTRVWREDDDQRLGLVITTAGRAIIGADVSEKTGGPTTAPQSKEDKASPAPRTGSKADLVLELLKRAEGATITDLTGATDWLPHTTRAALTGLRKKGYASRNRSVRT